jgi:hypothetical protein
MIMADNISAAVRKPDDEESDLIWGARNIGRELNRTEHQVYHLLAIGALDGVAAKLSHKMIVASRRGLRNLPFRKSK